MDIKKHFGQYPNSTNENYCPIIDHLFTFILKMFTQSTILSYETKPDMNEYKICISSDDSDVKLIYHYTILQRDVPCNEHRNFIRTSENYMNILTSEESSVKNNTIEIGLPSNSSIFSGDSDAETRCGFLVNNILYELFCIILDILSGTALGTWHINANSLEYTVSTSEMKSNLLLVTSAIKQSTNSNDKLNIYDANPLISNYAGDLTTLLMTGKYSFQNAQVISEDKIINMAKNRYPSSYYDITSGRSNQPIENGTEPGYYEDNLFQRCYKNIPEVNNIKSSSNSKSCNDAVSKTCERAKQKDDCKLHHHYYNKTDSTSEYSNEQGESYTGRNYSEHDSEELLSQSGHLKKNKIMKIGQESYNGTNTKDNIKKIYICKFCEKSFSQSQHVKRHERIHTGERPYKCKYCEKSFSHSGNFKEHERIHTGEKPYKCIHCEKSFRQVSQVKRHERIHTGEKPYKCKDCKIFFSSVKEMQRHARTHTGEKPYKCIFCEKSFPSTSEVKRHELIHTGEKPHKCKYCDKSFSRLYLFKCHEKIHNR